MNRFSCGPTTWLLVIGALLGAGFGYLLSSSLSIDSERLYRASISGLFLTNQEAYDAATQYVEGTTPSVVFVLRATPDARSTWRAGFLAKTYALSNETHFDISEEVLERRWTEGHTLVEALEGLEIITVTAWSENADSLAREAIGRLEAIDTASFGADAEPINVIAQRVDGPQWEIEGDRISRDLLRDIVQSQILSVNPGTSFLRAEVAFEDFFASSSASQLFGTDETVVTMVPRANGRNWTIDMEGEDLNQVNASAHQVGDFLRRTQLDSSSSGIDGVGILVDSIGAGLPLEDVSPFSPVITTTVSGLFLGLATGWAGMAFLRKRNENTESVDDKSRGSFKG